MSTVVRDTFMSICLARAARVDGETAGNRRRPESVALNGTASSRLDEKLLQGYLRGNSFWPGTDMAERDIKQWSRRVVVRSDLKPNGSATSMPKNQQPILHDIPHLLDHIPDLPRFENPLAHNDFFHMVDGFFLTESDMIAEIVTLDADDPGEQVYYRRAGPREKVLFQPQDVKAAIVTCGGVCPGINTVIRELVNTLCVQYCVKDVRGIRAGYRGFYASDHMRLDPKIVQDWHRRGGTMLGTTRGGFDLKKIVDSIEDHGLNQVYIIGGDGTMRGAVKIYEEVSRRKLKVSIVGIPKTVDNDIAIIDRSFGFQTAVEAAQGAINAAHTEAESTPNGVGLVQLMGRYTGHIALHATLSSRDVDCCLIPEVPFFMEGKGGLLEFLDQRVHKQGHMVIVTAEGAGQHLMPPPEEGTKDESGNMLLQDVGLWLSKELKKYWKTKYPDKPFSIKYVDPTYMVRAVPPNATDTLYCTLLSHSAVHGAMAGFTGFVAGPVNGGYCYIPLDIVATSQHVVDVRNSRWAWLKSVNNQPDFLEPGTNYGDPVRPGAELPKGEVLRS